MDFYSHLEKYLSKDNIDELKNSLSKEDKHAVILNTRKMSDEKFLSLFPNVKKHPLVEHGYIYDSSIYPLGKSIYHELGCFYIQEPSAMIVSSLLDFKDNDFVLDMCAAPGGKSIQASFKMHNDGLIISNDISFPRAELIGDNIERLGIKNIIITYNDFSKNYQNFKNTFDKIILDAPCSGSGMFRKDPKFLDDWSINKVYKFQEIQKQLLYYAYFMLKPGGTISYSTCSYSYEEDEEVILNLLNNSDAELVDIPNNPIFYKDKTNIGVHLFSHLFDGEGQYICHIKKPGKLIETKFDDPSSPLDKQCPFVKNMRLNKYKDSIYAINKYKKISELPILRNGFKVMEVNKDIYKPDYALSHVIDNYTNTVDISFDSACDYVLGNTINGEELEKGFILLTYEKIPLSFGKNDGRIIKNHYPKGLRKKISKFDKD